MPGSKNNRKLWILAGLAILATFLCTNCGDDEGDESNNQDCEAVCTIEYLEAMPGCDGASMSCLLGCDTPDDTGCMDKCQTCWAQLDDDLDGCESNCPCMVEWADCDSACTDHECLDWCETNFHTCIGNDSFYLTLSGCIEGKYMCEETCEEASTDMTQYLDCRIVCNSDFNDCLLQLDI